MVESHAHLAFAEPEERYQGTPKALQTGTNSSLANGAGVKVRGTSAGTTKLMNPAQQRGMVPTTSSLQFTSLLGEMTTSPVNGFKKQQADSYYHKRLLDVDDRSSFNGSARNIGRQSPKGCPVNGSGEVVRQHVLEQRCGLPRDDRSKFDDRSLSAKTHSPNCPKNFSDLAETHTRHKKPHFSSNLTKKLLENEKRNNHVSHEDKTIANSHTKRKVLEERNSSSYNNFHMKTACGKFSYNHNQRSEHVKHLNSSSHTCARSEKTPANHFASEKCLHKPIDNCSQPSPQRNLTNRFICRNTETKTQTATPKFSNNNVKLALYDKNNGNCFSHSKALRLYENTSAKPEICAGQKLNSLQTERVSRFESNAGKTAGLLRSESTQRYAVPPPHSKPVRSKSNLAELVGSQVKLANEVSIPKSSENVYDTIETCGCHKYAIERIDLVLKNSKSILDIGAANYDVPRPLNANFSGSPLFKSSENLLCAGDFNSTFRAIDTSGPCQCRRLRSDNDVTSKQFDETTQNDDKIRKSNHSDSGDSSATYATIETPTDLQHVASSFIKNESDLTKLHSKLQTLDLKEEKRRTPDIVKCSREATAVDKKSDEARRCYQMSNSQNVIHGRSPKSSSNSEKESDTYQDVSPTATVIHIPIINGFRANENKFVPRSSDDSKISFAKSASQSTTETPGAEEEIYSVIDEWPSHTQSDEHLRPSLSSESNKHSSSNFSHFDIPCAIELPESKVESFSSKYILNSSSVLSTLDPLKSGTWHPHPSVTARNTISAGNFGQDKLRRNTRHNCCSVLYSNTTGKLEMVEGQDKVHSTLPARNDEVIKNSCSSETCTNIGGNFQTFQKKNNAGSCNKTLGNVEAVNKRSTPEQQTIHDRLGQTGRVTFCSSMNELCALLSSEPNVNVYVYKVSPDCAKVQQSSTLLVLPSGDDKSLVEDSFKPGKTSSSSSEDCHQDVSGSGCGRTGDRCDGNPKNVSVNFDTVCKNSKENTKTPNNEKKECKRTIFQILRNVPSAKGKGNGQKQSGFGRLMKSKSTHDVSSSDLVSEGVTFVEPTYDHRDPGRIEETVRREALRFDYSSSWHNLRHFKHQMAPVGEI